MAETDIPDALVEPPKGFPIVWLLPFIALLLGGWWFYQALLDAPEEIQIQFPSATGIVVDKTEVRFKGISIGQVKGLAISEDLQSVEVKVEINRRAVPGLVEGTRFWLVTPRASLAGISGLDTLLAGSYINVAPAELGSGLPKRKFTALDEPPPLDTSVPGLHLTLEASDLGSLFIDAPVIYSDFTIGSVQAYKLRKDGLGVDVSIYIQPEFTYLVNVGSRFYNSSGISFSGDLTGFDLKLDSLASLLVGGITLHNGNIRNTAKAANGDSYQLYEDFAAAKAGEVIQLRLPTAEGLTAGRTQIKYKGYVIGHIQSLRLTADKQATLAKAAMVPGARRYLNSGARFWLVKPRLSLTEITGLETLVTGNYLEMEIGSGVDQREFVVLENPPMLSYDVPGLHITLRSETLASIERDTLVTYREITVGNVEGYELAADKKSILLHLFIQPEYAYLVNKSTRFWNTSGIDISGGLSGIKLRIGSIGSILRGGIAFSTDLATDKAGKARNGDVYDLYGDIEEATARGLEIHLAFSSGEGLAIGTVIKHMGIEVGKVKAVSLNHSLSGVTVTAVLAISAKQLAVEGSQFWVVKPQVGLTNVANLETIVSGRYIAVKPGSGERLTDFIGLNAEPTVEAKQLGLNIVLTSDHLGSLKSGVKLFYRGVPVGEITGYGLADNADQVRIYANIDQHYRQLVRKNSVFWDISGIDLSFGVFKGAQLKTNSVENILSGGIAFATPASSPLSPVAQPSSMFELHEKPAKGWSEWDTKIPLHGVKP